MSRRCCLNHLFTLKAAKLCVVRRQKYVEIDDWKSRNRRHKVKDGLSGAVDLLAVQPEACSTWTYK